MQALTKLTDRWRPRAFSEVVGQKRVIDWCRTKSQSTAESALFFGPSGCGKNTIARLYAQSLACEAPADDGLPCGACSACQSSTLDGSRSDFYAEINCAAVGTREIGYELDLLRIAPLTGRRRTLVFDEAHNLSRKAQDLLLRALERPKAPYTIVLLTTDIGRIQPAVQGRVARQHLVPPALEEVIAHGRRVCEAENIGCEDEALAILARSSGGRVRDFVQSLEDARGSENTITTGSARALLDLDDRCIDLLNHLLRGNLGGAESKVPSRGSDAQAMSELAGRIVLALEYRARQVIYEDELLSAALKSKLAELSELVRIRAEKAGLDERRLLADLARAFAFDGQRRGVHHLRSTLLDIHHRLHERAPRPARVHAQGSRKVARTRPHILARAARSNRMTLEQARRIWDACSLMVQVHGKYFNARIAMRPQGCGSEDLRRSHASLGRLIKNLTDRVQDWCGDDLHWAYAYSDEGGKPLAVVALALPDRVLSQCAAWLEKTTKDDEAVQFVVRTCSATSLSGRAFYHRRLLRLLCRSVDPGVGVRRKEPTTLVDAIGVSNRLRPKEAKRAPIPPRVSKTIGSSARREWQRLGLPVLTPASDGAWDYDFPGWEFHEHGDRQRELHRRQAAVAYASVTRDLELDGDVAVEDARQRRRSWTAKKPAWWQIG